MPYDVNPCWEARIPLPSDPRPPGPLRPPNPLPSPWPPQSQPRSRARAGPAPPCRARRGTPRGPAGLLTAVALVFLACFLVLPLVASSRRRSAKGGGYYLASVREPDALSAIRLTLLTVAIVVPANVAFRRRGRLGHREIQVPRQEPPDDAHRPALCRVPGHLRPHLRPRLRGPGLVRPVAHRAQHPDHLRRPGDRARHGLCHVSRSSPAS